MALNTELAGLLACPKCLGGLVVLPGQDGLYCAACAVVYPVRGGIPLMLVDEACALDRWTGSRPASGRP
ncbi:MAG: Trm112 family protein [Humidesulfovibrio sp.]